jgi:hypothetical protein
MTVHPTDLTSHTEVVMEPTSAISDLHAIGGPFCEVQCRQIMRQGLQPNFSRHIRNSRRDFLSPLMKIKEASFGSIMGNLTAAPLHPGLSMCAGPSRADVKALSVRKRHAVFSFNAEASYRWQMLSIHFDLQLWA